MNKLGMKLILLALSFMVLTACDEDDGYDTSLKKDPPLFEMGTMYLEPTMVTDKDPSTFKTIIYKGQFDRRMFDRRVDRDVKVHAYVFDITFDDGLTCEAQVNLEFESRENALVEAEKYSTAIGRIPHCLREKIRTISIHKGNNYFGGGDGDILVHTGMGEEYIKEGVLEEAMIHEAGHVSLDPYHYNKAYRKAQADDVAFVSKYAEDYPDREDIAESFVTFLMVECKADRIDDDMLEKIKTGNKHRLAYFRAQNFNVYPFKR
ncbi:hypothetical protein DF185_07765 [Marinifilum breve]|uniref:Lipoprotein n=1 Tax=Marinifilum breve TaxID=2184082 RepID=A0A2V4ABI7_9BACT|nr:hypothetical protein [Marinifilum breve]PXY01374.1 hypothetical protein DF185_07765 [Marinifilum breve]